MSAYRCLDRAAVSAAVLLVHTVICNPAIAGDQLACESLLDAADADIVVTPVNTGTCTGLNGEGVPCGPNRQFHVEIEWNQPLQDDVYAVRCTLANPTDSFGVSHNCYHAAPVGGFAHARDIVTHLNGDEVEDPNSPVEVYTQQTGEQYALGQPVYVQQIGQYLDRTTYCEGLAYDPAVVGDAIPWAQSQCCRDYFDQFFRVVPYQPFDRISFDIVAPLEAAGEGDWSFVVPRCGDGVRSCGERCDDGSTEGVDGCDNSCQKAVSCGRPVSKDGDEPVASDGLFVLRAAVNAATCHKCICDVNDDGKIVAADALRVVQRSVGLPRALDCSDCYRGNTAAEWDPQRQGYDYCNLWACPIDFGNLTNDCENGGCIPRQQCRICEGAVEQCVPGS